MTAARRPAILAVRLDGIPTDMAVTPRWGLWQLELKSGGEPAKQGDWTKVPYSARTGRRASSTKPDDWINFEAAVAAYQMNRGFDGLGFVLGDGWAGVDFDGCRDPETGEIAIAVQRWIARLDSYAEVSPSGTGVKVFMRGRLPEGADRNAQSGALGIKKVELYDHARYFTVTGHRV